MYNILAYLITKEDNVSKHTYKSNIIPHKGEYIITSRKEDNYTVHYWKVQDVVLSTIDNDICIIAFSDKNPINKLYIYS